MALFRYDIIPETPAGCVLAVSRGPVVVAVEMGLASPEDARRAVRERFADAKSGVTRAGRQLREYFARKRRTFDLEVDLSHLGRFHAAALGACAQIPFGRVATYGRIAAAAGSPRAARAAGSAMKRNPAGIVIPCHRVVAVSGPGGFSARGGLAVKRALLEFEGVSLCR